MKKWETYDDIDRRNAAMPKAALYKALECFSLALAITLLAMLSYGWVLIAFGVSKAATLAVIVALSFPFTYAVYGWD